MDRRDCPQKVAEEREEPEDATPKEIRDVAHIPADEEPAITENIHTTDLCGIGTSANLNCHSGRRKNSFPYLLFRILANPDYANIITWMPHGRAWKVFRPSEFARLVAPHYYSHAKFTSFIRQANGWGFRRITQGFDEGSYYHEMFLRGMPHLLNSMNRVKLEGGKMGASPEKEPDFYSMPWMPPVSGGPTGQPQAQAQQVASITCETAANEVEDEEDTDASSYGPSLAAPSPSPPTNSPDEKKRPREQASFNDSDRRCDAGCSVLVSGGPGAVMDGTTTLSSQSSAAPPVKFYQGRERREYAAFQAGNNYGSCGQNYGRYGGYVAAQVQYRSPACCPSPSRLASASATAPFLSNYASPLSHEQWGGQQQMLSPPVSKIPPHHPQMYPRRQFPPSNGQPAQAQPYRPQHTAFPPPPPLAGPFVERKSLFAQQQCEQPLEQVQQQEAQQMVPPQASLIEFDKNSPSYPRGSNGQQQQGQGQGQVNKQQQYHRSAAEERQHLQVMKRMQRQMISDTDRIVKAFSSAFSNVLLREMECFQGKMMEMLARKKDATMLHQQKKRAQQQGQAQQQHGQSQGQLPQWKGQGPPPQVAFPQDQHDHHTRISSSIANRPPAASMPPSRMMMSSPMNEAEGMIMNDQSAWDSILDDCDDNDACDEEEEGQQLWEEDKDKSALPGVCQPFLKKRRSSSRF